MLKLLIFSFLFVCVCRGCVFFGGMGKGGGGGFGVGGGGVGGLRSLQLIILAVLLQLPVWLFIPQLVDL